MKPVNNLTRWNRAGRKRFDYVDGNAVSYLENLREQLLARFADPATGRCDWLNPAQAIPANEQPTDQETLTQRNQRLAQRNRRLLDMYHQQRRDFLWEISRSFARACHVLSAHADAYANERFLGTATQWENVRKLVAMIDYHPAPPASAYTPLAFFAAPGATLEDGSALLPRGFQVVHTPVKGDKVIFETLEDLNLDPGLNLLRLAGWNRSVDPITAAGSGDNGDRFSAVANMPAIHLQGVGAIRAGRLAALNPPVTRIRDFYDRDIAALVASGIDEVRLRETRARAVDIIEFEPEGDWSSVADWLLPDIVAAPVQALATAAGKTPLAAQRLRQRIEMIGLDLDQPLFDQSRLRDLHHSAARLPPGIYPSYWIRSARPKVMAGKPALIFDNGRQLARSLTIETATPVDPVEPAASDERLLLELATSSAEADWPAWPKADVSLSYAPRWRRKCWLNGADVIRTVEPHGFKPGDFIGWKDAGHWRFAQVEKSGTRTLLLKDRDQRPGVGKQLVIVRPLEGPNLPADIEPDIGLSSGELLDSANVEDVKASALIDDREASAMPAVNTTGDTSGTNALLGIIPSLFGKLPEVGNFIVPTPMLPVDLVKAAVKLLLKIGVMVIPSTGKPVFEFINPAELATELYDAINDAVGVEWVQPAATVKAAIHQLLTDPEGSFDLPDPEQQIVLFKRLLDTVLARGPFLIVRKNPPVQAQVDFPFTSFVFNGKPDRITTGDWVIGRFEDGDRAVQIARIGEPEPFEAGTVFDVDLDGLTGQHGPLQEIIADFAGQLIPADADINTDKIGITLELEHLPESLRVGRRLLIGCGDEQPVLTTITSIDGMQVTTDPPVNGECHKTDLKIYGNVVLAGHGESKPAKNVGSGDATRSAQSFLLEVDQLAFVADPTMPAGVAAALEVEVDGRHWRQVATLRDSLPDDHHYTVRMTEAAQIRLQFGDGVNGRRLPTGNNNIRVTYRVGNGRGGNLPAGSLEKAVRPNPYVEAVRQPAASAGGNQMEGTEALRKNAPRSLLTLQRAVSASDFTHLATSQSSIWQAQTRLLPLQSDRRQRVYVTYLPVDAVNSPEIQRDLVAFLQRHAVAEVSVDAGPCVTRQFQLDVSLRVRADAFYLRQVEQAVHEALLYQLALERRQLGAPFYLSEAYAIVEAITGVENSTCILNGDPGQQLLAGRIDRIHYLFNPRDIAAPRLTVTAGAYNP